MSPSWMAVFNQMTPEIAVMVTLLSVMLSDIFLSKNPRSLWIQSMMGLTAASIAALMLFHVDTPSQALPLSISKVFVASKLTSGLKLVVLLLTALAAAFSYRSFSETTRHAGEFYALMLFSALGGILCISSQDLLMFFVSFELLSLPIYMLCGFPRYNSASAEAGLKYFINGALSSALMLFGISWIYGSMGTTNLPEIAARYQTIMDQAPQGLMVGCLLVMAGLAFKVAAAPFHSWAPDVYSGAPPAVSAYLATAPKIAMIGFVVRLFWNYLAAPAYFNLPQDWEWLFIIISVVSMFIGNLSALPQKDVRKILAYSGIAQIGYIFLGLAACSAHNPHPEKAIAAVLFYLVVYGMSNLGAWAVLAIVNRENQILDLESLKGLHQRSPLLAACLALSLMSLAGVPPLSGFMGKFYLFRSIYETQLPFLVVLGILNSVISLFYYFKVLKAAYFVEAEEGGPGFPVLPLVQRLAFHVCLWSNVVLGLWPGLIIEVNRVASTLTQGN